MKKHARRHEEAVRIAHIARSGDGTDLNDVVERLGDCVGVAQKMLETYYRELDRYSIDYPRIALTQKYDWDPVKDSRLWFDAGEDLSLPTDAGGSHALMLRVTDGEAAYWSSGQSPHSTIAFISTPGRAQFANRAKATVWPDRVAMVAANLVLDIVMFYFTGCQTMGLSSESVNALKSEFVRSRGLHPHGMQCRGFAPRYVCLSACIDGSMPSKRIEAAYRLWCEFRHFATSAGSVPLVSIDRHLSDLAVRVHEYGMMSRQKLLALLTAFWAKNPESDAFGVMTFRRPHQESKRASLISTMGVRARRYRRGLISICDAHRFRQLSIFSPYLLFFRLRRL